MTELMPFICMGIGLVCAGLLFACTIVWLFRKTYDKFLDNITTEHKKRYRGFKIGATKRKKSR